MKDVLLDADAPLAILGAKVCLQVHDSLVVEVRPGTGPRVHDELQRVLDDINVFDMRMLFTAQPWASHA